MSAPFHVGRCVTVLDATTLAVGETDQIRCYCTCPYHMADTGATCQITDAGMQYAVPMVGGIEESDRPVPMCEPCATWWVANRPERIREVASA